MNKSNRNSQIMWINALAILLVVIGHADMTAAYDQLWIKRWIYSFHMPLFVFVSGFLFCYTNPRIKEVSTGRFLMKKVRRLLLPFVAINSIIFLIKTLFSSDDYVQHPVVLTWDSYFDSTFFHPIGFMWFLPALFMIFVLLIFVAKQLGFREQCTIVWLGIGVIIWGISRFFPNILFMQISSALSYSVYFILGIIYSIRKEAFDYWLMRYKWICPAVLGGCSFALILPTVPAALVGIFFILSLSLWVRVESWQKFMLLSDYSFTIYLLSYFPQMLIRGPIYHRFEWMNEYVFSGISVLSGVLLPVGIGLIYSGIKNKNQLTKFLGNTIGL